MAIAHAGRVTAATNDVLSGTVVSPLPTDAPSYDVEVFLSREGTTNATATILAGGSAVLQNADVPPGTLAHNVATPAQTAHLRQQSDSPVARFNSPGGVPITLNIGASGTATNYYIEARENLSQNTGAIGVAHFDNIGTTTAGTQLDVFNGTTIGTLPNTAAIWQLNVSACLFVANNNIPASSGLDDDAVYATLLVGPDTLMERFLLPFRTNTGSAFPTEERDVMLSTLAAGGDKITLNIEHPGVDNSAVLVHAIAQPVG